MANPESRVLTLKDKFGQYVLSKRIWCIVEWEHGVALEKSIQHAVLFFLNRYFRGPPNPGRVAPASTHGRMVQHEEIPDQEKMQAPVVMAGDEVYGPCTAS